MSESRFQDFWLNAIGTAISGGLVYVCTQPNDVNPNDPTIPPDDLATIYTDSTGATELVNPVIVDGNGNFFFYADPGTYTLVFYDPLGRLQEPQVYPDMVVATPGGGSVSSVGFTMPAEFSVAGSPVDSSGTLAVTKAVQNAGTVYAGPATGSAAPPTFTSLTALLTALGIADGTVTSVAATFSTSSALLTISLTGSPINTSGTLAFVINLANVPANQFWRGPTSGSAAPPTVGAIVGADLPNPGASSLGGVQSIAAVTHQFLTSISTLGVPTQAQPAFTDISGLIKASQQPALVATAFTATPVFDASAGSSFTITLTGAVTSSSVTNPTAGQTITFIITQDGSGSHAFAFPANFKGATVIDSAANHVSVQSFIWDGSAWRATSIGSQTSS